MSSKDKKDPLINNINNDIKDVKEIMQTNINKEIKYNQILEKELEPFAVNIKENAELFNKDAKKLNNETYSCWDKCLFGGTCSRNCCRIIVFLTIIVLIVIIYFLVAIIRCNSANIIC